jgi:hypothetical protein
VFRKILTGFVGIFVSTYAIEASSSDESTVALEKVRRQFENQQRPLFSACHDGLQQMQRELDSIASKNGFLEKMARYKEFLSLAEKLCKCVVENDSGQGILTDLEKATNLIKDSAAQKTGEPCLKADTKISDDAVPLELDESVLQDEESEEEPLAQELLDALFEYDRLSQQLAAEVHSILEEAKTGNDISTLRLEALVAQVRDTTYYKDNKIDAANELFRMIEYLQYCENTKKLYESFFVVIKKDYDEAAKLVKD